MKQLFLPLVLIASGALGATPANAAPPSTDLKAYILENASYAACRLKRNEITRAQSREFMENITISAIRNYGLSGKDVRQLNTWTESEEAMKAIVRLTSIRVKHGRGNTLCSMNGDNNWMPYVQKQARQS